MNKHVQIRNVSPALHRRLKMRAAQQGMTLSDYLRRELELIARLPTLKEWTEMVRSQESSTLSPEEIVEAIHAAREDHDRKFEAGDNRRQG
jgi:plasmid stability protein